jgi:hypothetical protein
LYIFASQRKITFYKLFVSWFIFYICHLLMSICIIYLFNSFILPWQTTTQKTEHWATQTPLKSWGILMCSVPAPLMTPFVLQLISFLPDFVFFSNVWLQFYKQHIVDLSKSTSYSNQHMFRNRPDWTGVCWFYRIPDIYRWEVFDIYRWEMFWIPLAIRNDTMSITCIYRTSLSSKAVWSYGSWIYNYICNQCLFPLTLWVRISLMVRCTWYSIMW